MTRTLLIVATVAIGVMLVGCADQTGVGSDWDPSNAASALSHAKEAGYTEAATVLADGKVTKEEWRSLHEDWVGCMTKLGYDFDPPLLDPINGREYVENRKYNGPGGGPKSSDLDQCDARFDFSVGQIYYNDTPATMEPTLLAAVHSCLDGKHLQYEGNETKYEDFFTSGDKSLGGPMTGPVADCVGSSVRALYPNLQSWGLGF